MKSRIKPELEAFIYEQPGEIGRLKAGELSRSLKKKMLENPEFLAAVEQRMQERAKQNANPEQAQTATV